MQFGPDLATDQVQAKHDGHECKLICMLKSNREEVKTQEGMIDHLSANRTEMVQIDSCSDQSPEDEKR